MNVDILVELLGKIGELEQANPIQKQLKQLSRQLSDEATVVSIGNSPSQRFGKNISALIDDTYTKMEFIDRELSAADVQRLSEFASHHLFTSVIIANLKKALSDTSKFNLEIAEVFKKDVDSRERFLRLSHDTLTSLIRLRFDQSENPRDQIQVGFQFPREMFANSFDGFLKEMNTLRFMVNSISLVELGEPANANLGILSTSNPLVFLGVKGQLAFALAASITWGLSTWIQIEEIRKYRTEANAIPALEQLNDHFDEIIQKQLDEAVSARVEELTKGKKQDPEMESVLAKAHTLILERLERGVTFELRLNNLSENDPDNNPNADEFSEPLDVFEKLREVSRHIRFPEPDNRPVLNLTHDDSSYEIAQN